MAIMGTTHTLALLTDITAQIGSWAASSSAPDRGSMAGVGGAVATGADEAGMDGRDLEAVSQAMAAWLLREADLLDGAE
jgi:hypothetical protein